jgi:Flp pilus assembly protein TadD
VNNNLAVEYTSRGNLTRARERLEVALRTAPLYWRAHVNMGIIAHQLHDDGTAIRFLQQARRIDPSAPSPPFFLGVVLADQGDLAAAIRSLADAEDAAPLDARTRLYRGWYLYRLGRIPEARSELLRARELDPSDPRAAAYLAEIADRGSGRAASAGPK